MKKNFWQLYIIIKFFLPIYINLKDKYQLIIIKENFFNKQLLINLESNTSSLTILSSYRNNKVETMLSFMDINRLAHIA